MHIFSYLFFFTLLISQDGKIKISSYSKELISDTLNFHLNIDDSLDSYFQIDSIILNPKTVVYMKKKKKSR